MTDALIELIDFEPDVIHGQARIRGTRIPVSVVLDCLAAGMTEKQILAQYPTLTVEGIRAAVAYGAALARRDGTLDEEEALRLATEEVAAIRRRRQHP